MRYFFGVGCKLLMVRWKRGGVSLAELIFGKTMQTLRMFGQAVFVVLWNMWNNRTRALSRKLLQADAKILAEFSDASGLWWMPLAGLSTGFFPPAII
jgi:hypothetical protein